LGATATGERLRGPGGERAAPFAALTSRPDQPHRSPRQVAPAS